MELFKVGALVVWRGEVVPIVNRWVARDGAVYLIHTKGKDRGLVSDNVTFGPLVAELTAYARWSVGDKVEVGPWDKYIHARWWNTRRGVVMYRINDKLDNSRTARVLSQDELAAKVDQYVQHLSTIVGSGPR